MVRRRTTKRLVGSRAPALGALNRDLNLNTLGSYSELGTNESARCAGKDSAMMKDYTIVKNSNSTGITVIGRPLEGVPGHNRCFWVELTPDGKPSCIDSGFCEPERVLEFGVPVGIGELHPQARRQVRIWLRTYLDE